MYYSLLFTPEQVQVERWINRTLSKTEPTAKEKIRHVGKKYILFLWNHSRSFVGPAQQGARRVFFVSWRHRLRVQNNRGGNGSATPHMTHTWPAGHSRVWHEVLPLLPAVLLRQHLWSQHLCAVACPGLGRWGTWLISGSPEHPLLQPCYC